MRRSFCWLLKVAGFALVLVAAMRLPAIGQDAERGGRPTRATGQPASTEQPAAERSRLLRFLQRGRDETSGSEPLDEAPAEAIALTLWILSIGDSAQPPADNQPAKLAERIDNLPLVGSISEVRELVRQWKAAGLVRSATKFRLVTLDGQVAMHQQGKNQPRIIATAISRDGKVNSVQYELVGTIVEIRPRIDTERNIKIGIKINKSELVKSPDVILSEPADGSPLFADVITTRQFNTTASLENDTAVLLQSVTAKGPEGDETELIILGAKIMPTNE